MAGNSRTLTVAELSNGRVAGRFMRIAAVITMAIALPLVVALALPLVGWALLAVILFSPLFLAWVLVAASHRADVERQLES